MSIITKEQILKINNACSNGWQLNMFYYQTHQVKTLINKIEIDEKNFLGFELYYNSQNQISLKISKFYYVVDDLASTSGAYKTIILDETPTKRKSINNLIPFTKDLDKDKLMELS